MVTQMGPLTWNEIAERVHQLEGTVYDWCWVCGVRLGPDKMHVLIDNGRFQRHTYCCRKHRYVVVLLPGTSRIQERTDLEIESLAAAFKMGELQPGWE
jgi:hypothetical protein